MKIRNLHPWNVTANEALEIQNSLKKAVKLERVTEPSLFKTVAGTDVSYCKKTRRLFAAVLVFSIKDMSLIEQSDVCVKESFPYIPGFLSFREAPVIIECLKKLKTVPDVITVDGQGTAHPRHFGLACHLGLFANIPVVGCAKSLLTGKCGEPAKKPGSFAYIKDKNSVIGVSLRTRKKVKPVFVSPGHKITLDDSIAIVLATCMGYRIPHQNRMAHIHVNKIRLQHK